MMSLSEFADWKRLHRHGCSRLLAACFMASPALAHGQTGTTPREGVPTLSGYMEMHLNKVEDLPASVDLHRFVVMIGHSFSDRLKFWSEVEVEHGPFSAKLAGSPRVTELSNCFPSGVQPA